MDGAIQRDFYASIITTILSNDWDLTKFSNWAMLAKVVVYCRLKKGRTDLDRGALKFTNYLTPEMKEQLINTIEANEGTV